MSHRFCLARAVLVALAGATHGACVLADPPASLPIEQESPPQIVTSSVVPPSTTPLFEWPANDTFIVPVQLTDPTRVVQWKAFIDYLPYANNPPGNVFSGQQAMNTANDLYVTTINAQILRPESTAGQNCFTVTIVVAFAFNTNDMLITPDPQGGSLATWAYQPDGPDRCLGYDAGVIAKASIRDAGDGGGG